MSAVQVGDVYDNGGATIDRYTVEIMYGCTDGDYEGAYFIASGPSGNVPNGVFMTVDGPPYDGQEISFEDLPERVQRDILAEVRWADRETARA